MIVHDAAEHEAGHRDRGLVGPAEGPPDLVLRLLLCLVVGQIERAARGVQEHHLVMLLGDLEHRAEFRLVERLAVDVGMQLHAAGAVLERTLEFLGRVRRIHRQRGEPAAEVVLFLDAELGHAVVAELGEFLDLLGRAERFQRRHAQRDDLRVVILVAEHVADLLATVEIVDGGNAAHARADVGRGAGGRQHLVPQTLREIVVETVDITHGMGFLRSGRGLTRDRRERRAHK